MVKNLSDGVTSKSSVAPETPAAHYAFRLDAPLQVLDGLRETAPISAKNFASMYRLVDDMLSGNLYNAQPHTFSERLTGTLWRLPLALSASFINHELGHQRMALFRNYDFTIAEDHPSFEASYYSGGLERSMAFANALLTKATTRQATFGEHLEYALVKLDNTLQTYWAPTVQRHFFGGNDILCNNCSTAKPDPFEIGDQIIIGRKKYADKHGIVLPEDPEKIRGYSDMPGIIGNVVHLLDPFFLWSASQVLAGDGGPVPTALPQLHYLDSAEGPMIFARFRHAPRRNPNGTAGTLLEYGAFTTINDRSDGKQALGYEVAAHHLPLLGDQLTVDLAHRGALLPIEGFVADAEANFKIGMGPNWALTVGLNYKFGDGYLPLGHFFEGPAMMLGLELTPSSSD